MCSRAGSADAGTAAPLACSTTSFSSASTACAADVAPLAVSQIHVVMCWTPCYRAPQVSVLNLILTTHGSPEIRGQ